MRQMIDGKRPEKIWHRIQRNKTKCSAFMRALFWFLHCYNVKLESYTKNAFFSNVRTSPAGMISIVGNHFHGSRYGSIRAYERTLLMSWKVVAACCIPCWILNNISWYVTLEGWYSCTLIFHKQHWCIITW